MSRIGKLAIPIPNNVEINYNNSKITVSGKFGNLELSIPNSIEVIENKNTIHVNLKEKTRDTKALHGLYRTLINNMVIGVSEQFELILVLKGVGYRAALQGKEITLNLGYSHPVKMKIPEGINV